MSLIDLEGDTNFTLQNQLAVKGQKLGLCLPAVCHLFSHRLIFMRARVSLSLLSLRKNGGLLIVYAASKSFIFSDNVYCPAHSIVLTICIYL